nr:MAG TPA: hypothetical protein [Caudoviricetes sp.]
MFSPASSRIYISLVFIYHLSHFATLTFRYSL